ncbi:type VI secretion protein [Streptomyces beijiangensis]|uniref:type VI secretion protein n=1 Tax=Streptomyces beijiangensis TaxID=163361 RepID=UPI00360FB20F
MPDALLVGVLAFLLGLTILTWLATGLAGLFAKGAWPTGVTFTRTPLALRELIQSPHDLAAAWPETPASQLSGYGLFWGLLISEFLVLTVLTIFVLGTVTRWRAVREARKQHPLPEASIPAQPGSSAPADHDAPVAGPQSAGGEAVSPFPGPQPPTAPSPPLEAPHPTPQPARVERVGSQPGPQAGPTPHPPAPAPVPAYAPATAPAPASAQPPLQFAPAAARKEIALQAIQDAEGPALVVTSDPTVWSETKDARSKLGPVLVYDPGHLCDTPARLHWSPTTGCEDHDIAAARAIALLAPVRPQARMDATMAETAETLLRSWLHAAAIDNRPFKQVHRWAHATNNTHEPVRILRTHPKASSGAAGLLESALTAHPQRREIAQQLTIRALSALSSIHIRETCTPNRADSLVLESFIDEGGTLYVVGEAIEDPRSHPGAMPLLTALTASVVEHGRRLAERSADGRLDPPMTLVLDDVAAVAPLPRLPELLSNGQDQGLSTLVLLRSLEQQRSRWPELNTPTA